MNKTLAVALALLIGLGAGIGIGYVAWGGGMGMGGMMGGGSMMGSGNTERSGPAPKRGAQTLTVTAREFSFSPDHLSLRAGHTVNVEFSDAGQMFHTFTLTGGTSFNLQANPGDSVAGALTISKPGTYQFICAVQGHAQAGMRGTISVR